MKNINTMIVTFKSAHASGDLTGLVRVYICRAICTGDEMPLSPYSAHPAFHLWFVKNVALQNVEKVMLLSIDMVESDF